MFEWGASIKLRRTRSLIVAKFGQRCVEVLGDLDLAPKRPNRRLRPVRGTRVSIATGLPARAMKMFSPAAAREANLERLLFASFMLTMVAMHHANAHGFLGAGVKWQ